MGMPKIELRLQMFRGDWDQVWSQKRMIFAMEGLVRVNQTHFQQFEEFKKRGLVEKNYPSIYQAGVHYETEKGTEIWPDVPSLLMGTMGKGNYPGLWGDCEDLSCYRTAELRELPFHYARQAPWDKKKVERADPRFPQGKAEMEAQKAGKDWPGWKKVKGGIKAMPFAKWRRGPTGNYHYHALTLLPDGRLEDPSLVLGMGREREFADAGMAEKLKNGTAPVILQFAKTPDVMVVDPEKPSGYAGGKAKELDAKVLAKAKAAGTATPVAGDAELGAYMANEIPLSAGEFDVDAVIGWDRTTRSFGIKDEKSEERRLLGYSKH